MNGFPRTVEEFFIVARRVQADMGGRIRLKSHLARIAKACRKAIAELAKARLQWADETQKAKAVKANALALEEVNGCSAVAAAWVLQHPGEESLPPDLIEALESIAICCERIGHKRGAPRDWPLWLLIKSCHVDFQRRNPDRKGYWREFGTGQYKGRFLEEMKQTLERLGYPAQSREALGDAIEKALQQLQILRSRRTSA